MLSVVITHLDCGSETAQSPNPNWSRSWSWSWTGWTGQTAAHGGRAGGREDETAFQSRQTEWTRDRSATATRSQASPDTRREGHRGSRPLAALARGQGRGPVHTPEGLPRPRPGPAHPVRMRAAIALPLPLRNFDRILEVPGGARSTSALCAWAARPSVGEELAGAREPQGQEGGGAPASGSALLSPQPVPGRSDNKLSSCPCCRQPPGALRQRECVCAPDEQLSTRWPPARPTVPAAGHGLLLPEAVHPDSASRGQ